jgi:hypothetical protein
LFVAASVISPAEGNLVIFVGDNPMIADSNAMSVPAERTEDRFRPAEGGLGVNHPVLVTEFLHQRRKLPWCGEDGSRAAEVEFLLPESAAKSSDELAPADPAENLDREEESILGVNPALVIWCKPSSRNHAVNMRMVPSSRTIP